MKKKTYLSKISGKGFISGKKPLEKVFCMNEYFWRTRIALMKHLFLIKQAVMKIKLTYCNDLIYGVKCFIEIYCYHELCSVLE